nr:hypothetical protein [Clostridium botulinum]
MYQEGKDGIVKEFEEKIYKESYEFINKMQNEYKIDLLNLAAWQLPNMVDRLE